MKVIIQDMYHKVNMNIKNKKIQMMKIYKLKKFNNKIIMLNKKERKFMKKVQKRLVKSNNMKMKLKERSIKQRMKRNRKNKNKNKNKKKETQKLRQQRNKIHKIMRNRPYKNKMNLVNKKIKMK